MGGNSSCCCSNPTEYQEIEEQYQSLVVSKPAPLVLEKVAFNQSDSDIPLFQQVDSNSDNEIISDPKTISDEELNLFAQKI